MGAGTARGASAWSPGRRSRGHSRRGSTWRNYRLLYRVLAAPLVAGGTGLPAWLGCAREGVERCRTTDDDTHDVLPGHSHEARVGDGLGLAHERGLRPDQHDAQDAHV